jgi:DNA-binding transcriptional LysR family regulator
MVAQGLGLTLLPDYSVEGDPLTVSGVLTYRRLLDDDTRVRLLMVVRERPASAPALQALQASLVRFAAEYRPAVPGSTRIA